MIDDWWLKIDSFSRKLKVSIKNRTPYVHTYGLQLLVPAWQTCDRSWIESRLWYDLKLTTNPGDRRICFVGIEDYVRRQGNRIHNNRIRSNRERKSSKHAIDRRDTRRLSRLDAYSTKRWGWPGLCHRVSVGLYPGLQLHARCLGGKGTQWYVCWFVSCLVFLDCLLREDWVVSLSLSLRRLALNSSVRSVSKFLIHS